MPTPALDRIFRARSVALVGLSADARKLNGAPLNILRTTGFPGAIYPVNPKYDAIDGLRCYARFGDLPQVPDVALVMVPARDVPAALEACGRKGTQAAVVISSGFEEAGGEALAAQVKTICVAHRIALVGPNCEGVWSVRARVLLTFGSAAKRAQLAHRPVAIISQSGAMAGAIARHLQDSGFGCAYVISVGNETILGLLDYIEYMIDQDDVRVVLLFLEGLKDGARLLALAERARTRGIVIVALKAGNSSIGRAAAASHTGKIATTSDVYANVFEQAGLILVDGLVEMIEAAEVLSTLAPPKASGRAEAGLAIYSIPGGTRALTADLCESRGVPLARFQRDTVAALQAKLPEFGYAENPTDITGRILSAPELLNDTLGIVAQDAGTEALLVQLANRGPQDALHYRQTIQDIAAATGVPTIIGFLGDALPGAQRSEFAQHGIVCARDPSDAVRYFGWLFKARAILARAPRSISPSLPNRSAPARLDWSGLMSILKEARIPAPRWALLATGSSARVCARALRYPVALKVLPEDAEHKTERGLLRLNLVDAAAVDAAAVDLRRLLGRTDATLVIQEMVAGGIECVVAARRDPDFGAILSLGSGGVMVELMRDLGHLCLPADSADVERLLDRLTLNRLLAGFRGAPAADRESLVNAVVQLGRAFLSLDIEEIEINPMIVLPKGEGVCALDILARSTGVSGAIPWKH